MEGLEAELSKKDDVQSDEEDEDINLSEMFARDFRKEAVKFSRYVIF